MSTPNPLVDPTPVPPVSPVVPPMPAPIKPQKPSYLSPAFYVTVATYIIPIITLVFHQDFSPLVPAVSVAASGVATVAYTIYMAIKNHAYVQAQSQYNKTLMDMHYITYYERAAI